MIKALIVSIGRYFVYSGWRKRSHTSNRPWKGLWTSLVSDRQDVAKLQPLVQKTKQTKRNPRFVLDPNMSEYQRFPTFVRTTNSQETLWIRKGLNDPYFELRQEPETYLFSTSRPAPGPTQPPIQRVGALFQRKVATTWKSTTHRHLVPSLRMVKLYLYASYITFMARRTFYLLPYKGHINAKGTV